MIDQLYKKVLITKHCQKLKKKEYFKEMVKMNQQIDAEKLINILVGKIAELELENAKLKVLIEDGEVMNGV